VSADAPLPPPYLIGHIQDALAADDRSRELGVDVTLAGPEPRVVLTGTVSTEAQRRAIGEVVAEVAPGHDVVNELAVVSTDEGGAVEELA
jgi:osmotically-inducible protein OsmY